MSEFSEKMGMAAGNNFKSGYNCCEAIVETFISFFLLQFLRNFFNTFQISLFHRR